MFGFLKRGAPERGDAEERTRRALLRILELNKEMARAARSGAGSSASKGALPDRILDAAIELVGAERGFLIQSAAADAEAEEPAPGGEADGRWEVLAARNIDRENVRRALQKVSRSITATVLKTGEAFRSDDAVNDEAFVPSESVTELRLRSVLCVPLCVGEEVAGCLYVDNRFAQGQFDEIAQEVLEAFSDQASLALEHLRLTAENERVRADLEQANTQLVAALEAQAQALDSLSGAEAAPTRDLRFEYPRIVGRGRAMSAMLSVVDRVTEGDFPVLLVGESGTGKELVARALHANGPRSERPFVGVNCGAIAEGLLESELFGSVKGAFTGAVRDREGLFEAAEGGVLFLDEIGEMSLGLQAKLLRVLQERRVRRVGGNDETPIDVRVVSATNRDLAREVAAGGFREDLYYRLKVVQIEIPPLRERREDIPDLVEHVLDGLVASDKEERVRPTVTPACLEALAAHDWPGNVRELQNELTRMVALGGHELGPELLEHLALAPRAASGDLRALVGRRLADVEAEMIRATLEATGGKRGEAARMLGIPRRTFYNRLKALGVDA